MKKHILPLLAALALPFACTVVEDPGVTEDLADSTTTSLVISANPSGITKAVLNEDNSVSFVDGDAISVFGCQILEEYGIREYEEPSKFSTSRIYADGSADFEGQVGSTDGPMPVMYPYQDGAKIVKYNKVNRLEFTIPVVQEAVPGSYDPAAAISLGMAEMSGDGTASASLDNACTLIKFTVPFGEYGKVTLNATTGICGACYANVSSDAIGNIVLSGMDTEVSEIVSLEGDITGGNVYFIAVAPGEYPDGFSIRLYDKKDELAGEKTTAKSVTFKKGRILNLGALPTISPTWAGDGTKDRPYEIASSAHLKLLAQAFSLRETAKQYEGKYFKQTTDINMDGEAITIGNYSDRYQDTTPSWQVPTAFNAHYDGGGYTISNYKLKFINYRLDSHYLAGLFNIVSNATIENLNLRPAKQESGFLIDGLTSTANYYYIGLLAGEIDGECTISNCHVLPDSYTVSAYAGSSFDPSQTVVLGGLVGRTIAHGGRSVKLLNCTNAANLTIEGGVHQNVAGGLIGTNYGGYHYQYIDRCRNKGNITVISTKEKSGPEVFAGGIIGRITDDGSDVVFRISNCVNEGKITATNKYADDACAGGIAGSNNSDGWYDLGGSVDPWVYNCLNKGDIHAGCLDGMTTVGYDAYAGGIFGYCFDYDTRLALCVNVGHITATGAPMVGPICGTRGTHLWCFWLDADEFEGFVYYEYTNCHACTGFIKGSGDNAGTPEYVRLHGKANDSESGLIWEKTDWSQAQWASAAQWTGSSNSNWDDESTYENTLDLVF